MTTAAEQPARPAITWGLVVLDTPDLVRTADFYQQLMGVEALHTDDDWITLQPVPNGPQLAFQLATDFTPPSWPSADVPQQFHLDLYVDDLDAAEAYALSIGARPVEGPNTNDDFRVYLDPVGHPFCFCVNGGS